MNPLSTLSPRLEQFLFELGTLQYQHGAGLSTELPLQTLHRRFLEFSREETFAQVREASENSRLDDDVRRRLKRVLEFLAGEMEEALAASAQEEISRYEASARVSTESEEKPLREAQVRLAREPQRLRRGALEKAVSECLAENPGPYIRRREAALLTAERLKYPSYLALREAVSGIEFGPLSEACAQVLAKTEDAYRDLLGYALKKLDPMLKASSARRHDLVWISSAPWMAEHFTREQLLPSVVRWLGEMGFTPHADGRIRLDTEEREAKSERAFVAALRIPEDIRLVVRPGGGMEDYFSLLHEWGHAQHLAHLSVHLPLEDRRLADASLTEAYAFLFHHLLVDEAWHRRYLGLSKPAAREAARLAAFNDLCRLRKYAARLPYELSLYTSGPGAGRAEEYEERMSAALGVTVSRGFYLQDVDPQLYSARYLRAWGLEVQLHAFCQGRFNEDYWRNPAAGAWLKGQFTLGQTQSAEGVARQLGEECSLLAAGLRLVSVMGA